MIKSSHHSRVLAKDFFDNLSAPKSMHCNSLGLERATRSELMKGVPLPTAAQYKQDARAKAKSSEKISS